MSSEPIAPVPAVDLPDIGPTPHVRRERVSITMPDGVRLSGILWLPLDASADRRYACVFEMSPYRSDDLGMKSDLNMASYLTGHGFAFASVDARGTGRSEGAMTNQYSAEEIQDGVDLIAWLAEQPWCTGNIGMCGGSWTGINLLSIARRQPQALKAIAICGSSADDEFADDAYFDGFLNVDDWDFAADHIFTVTRAPDFPLDEASLAARFDQPPFSMEWLRYQRNGPFWKQRGLARDYDAIEVPVLWWAGWYDGNQDVVPRLMEHLKVPVKAIVGPWEHATPDEDTPGPCVHWQHETTRWWERWLNGTPNGVDEEPKLTVYVRGWHPAGPQTDPIPGSWRTEDAWPIHRGRDVPFFLGPGRATSTVPVPETTEQLGYTPSAGTTVPMYWCGFFPDPRTDDAFSLTYDSEPLGAELEILGSPRALLRGSADAPLAHWFVRIEDVAPDGSATTVTGGGLNGAQRESDTDPTPLEPGVTYPFEFDLRFTSWVFPVGHRIRVSFCNAWWPTAWASPYRMTTTLNLGGADGSRVVLPVVPFEERPGPGFLLPPDPPSVPLRTTSGRTPDWITRASDGSVTMGIGRSNVVDYAWGRQLRTTTGRFTINDRHPEAMAVWSDQTWEVELPDRRVTWRTQTEVWSTETHFHYTCKRELRLDGHLIRERDWAEQIPRDLQ